MGTTETPQDRLPDATPAPQSAGARKSIEESKALIRAVVSFFAALVGFGMQAVLQSQEFEIQQNRWWLFLVLSLFALRILSGASVHLIASHHSTFRSALSLLLDICVLFALAITLVFVANQPTLAEFFCWFLIIPLMSCAWALLDNGLARRSRSRDDPEISTALKSSFFFINIAYALGLAVIIGLDRANPPFVTDTILGVRSPVALLVILSVVIAIYDLHKQYKVVEKMVT